MREIKQIEDLLQSTLKESGSTFVDYTTRIFTVPGENYGSLMLGVDVKLKDPEGNDINLSIVAKKIPENEWLQNMFKVQYTFVKEMNFYDTVIPTLKKFQLDQGMEEVMDFFPKYYGGRINLQPGSDKVDEDGVMLLDNLKLSGYETWDRIKGFDLDMTKFILNDLAVFHAVPIALRLKNPDIFNKKIRPFVNFVRLFDDGNVEMEKKMFGQFEDIAKMSEETAHLTESVLESMRHTMKVWGTPYDGSFATITHNDYWVNNTMVKFENGEIVGNKIIDFQVVDYGSPGKDIVFFLFSSVQNDVIINYYDDLLNLYYNKFIDTLKQLNCDLEEFTFEAFGKVLENAAKSTEFFHCMIMTKPMMASPQDIPELKDMSVDKLVDQVISQRQIAKAHFVIKEFAKRNWI